MPLLFEFFAGAELTSVKPLPLTIVDGLRGRGPVGNRPPLLLCLYSSLIPTRAIISLPQPLCLSDPNTTLFGGTDHNVCYSRLWDGALEAGLALGDLGCVGERKKVVWRLKVMRGKKICPSGGKSLDFKWQGQCPLESSC